MTNRLPLQTRRGFLHTVGLAVAGTACAPCLSHAATVKRPLPDSDLSFIESELIVKRRREWTNRTIRPWRLRAAGLFDRITVHHTGNGIPAVTDEGEIIRRLDGILTAHMDRNYGDLGYHFVVDYTGRVWEGRSLAYEGAHVSYQNERNIGVMLLGNFEKQRPSSAQSWTCEALLERLRSEYRIKKHRIYGHRDLGQSVCPGKNLYSLVIRWRESELQKRGV